LRINKGYTIKRILLISGIIVLLGGRLAAGKAPVLEAEAAILIDARSGRILYEKNSMKEMQPASLTKLMTAYITLNRSAAGDLDWDDRAKMTRYAFRIASNWSLSNTPVIIREKAYSILELFEAALIFSSNSAAITLAEHIAGTEVEFVKQMNEKARDMGMNSSKFYDSTGLSNGKIQVKMPYSEGGNKMSARDVALLAWYILREYPHVLKITSIRNKKYSMNGDKGTVMGNSNWMIPGLRAGYRGLDGLKTGHTRSAGYCFVATARRDGMRLISVIMKARTRSVCFRQTKSLLDWGFAEFSLDEYVPNGYSLNIPLESNLEDYVPVVTVEPLKQIVRKRDVNSPDIQYHLKSPYDRKLLAPLQMGEVVGVLKSAGHSDKDKTYISEEGRSIESAKIVVNKDITRPGWMRMVFHQLHLFVFDWYGIP